MSMATRIIFLIVCLTTLACKNDKLVTGQYPDHPLFHLNSDTQWTLVKEIPLRFRAWHTQGIVKIGPYYYVSTVEVIRRTKRLEQPQGKLDRDAGEGRGHIIKFDEEGNLLADLLVGEGNAYHPGGMDYDGKYIWVPVTEYRPFSFSVIYRVNPETMTAEKVMEYNESIGAIVHDTEKRMLIGVNWDARIFYPWLMDKTGKVTNADVAPEKLGIRRCSFYVAFQDGQYLGDHLMFWSGSMGVSNGEQSLAVGGWEVFDTRDFRPVYQLPVKLYTPEGRVMTGNPCAIETTDSQHIRAYFLPRDVLYVYESQ